MNVVSNNEFKLFAEYQTGSPVRCLTTSPLGFIISGGQDSLMRQFCLSENSLDPVGECVSHNHWVVALATLPSGRSPIFPVSRPYTCLNLFIISIEVL